ncbi:MAG: phbC, partial [Proteobacteria bacterium]|nr:phbC [Pseudomonadota bacterium]
PSKNRRSYWVASDTSLPATADVWLHDAREKPGSWWADWDAWLKQFAGGERAAPKSYGSAKHKVIEPAPGRYVKEKA